MLRPVISYLGDKNTEGKGHEILNQCGKESRQVLQRFLLGFYVLLFKNINADICATEGGNAIISSISSTKLKQVISLRRCFNTGTVIVT